MKCHSNQATLSLVVTLTLLAACGGGGSGNGGASALVGGEWAPHGTSSAGNSEFQINVSSRADVCTLSQQHSSVANATDVELDLTAPAGQTTVPPGTYTVTADGDTQAQSKVRDVSCNDTKIDATGGTITLTSTLGAANSTASGSFDVTFEDGSHRSGTFTANFCDTSVTLPAGPSCIGGTDSSSSGGTSGAGGSSASSGGTPTNSGGTPDTGGSTSTTGWGSVSTCNSGASVIYQCCAIGGSSCQTPSAYASCCENSSCAPGEGIACLAKYEGNTLDPTTCAADVQACGL
jgi:hypothetical protein